MAKDKDPLETAPTPPEAPIAPVAPINPLVAASNIPPVTVKTAANIPAAPSDAPKIEDYKGLFVNANDGETYALAIKEDAPDGRTHFLLNEVHFDNCTREEFKQRYEKVDKK